MMSELSAVGCPLFLLGPIDRNLIGIEFLLWRESNTADAAPRFHLRGAAFYSNTTQKRYINFRMAMDQGPAILPSPPN